MSRWVDLDSCPCNECLIKVDCIARYDGECSKYKEWKKGADVAPVKHGKWRYRCTFNTEQLIYPCQCSECRHHAYQCEEFNDDEINYCPNCGADMREQHAKSEC